MGEGKRQNGRSVFPFSNGRSLGLDATCTDTYAYTNIYSWAVSVGHAVREAEEQKLRKYGALGARSRFESVAVDSRCVCKVHSSAYIERSVD